MNKMGISTEPSLLGVPLNINGSISESPSTATFLQEEDVSICPLLPNTPSPPLTFCHPLDSVDNSSVNGSQGSGVGIEDTTKVVDETSSSGSSSGIVMDVNDNNAAKTLFNKTAYQHIRKTNDNGVFPESGIKSVGILNIPINKDTPNFVSWNWPLIRKCTFFLFMSSLLAMFATVVAMIMTLPTTCNPEHVWYRGNVFYEIFPASFQDSNKDSIGDLRGIISRLDYLENLGVKAIRLNSIFQSPHYPDDYENVTSLTEIDKLLGTSENLELLADALHARNMSLLLDLPIYPFIKQLNISENHNENSTDHIRMATNLISEAIEKWARLGCDGFYIKGLEYLMDDEHLLDNIREWKYLLGGDRIIIVSENFFFNLNKNLAYEIAKNIDLVEVHLNISSSTKHIQTHIKSILNGPLAPHNDGVWIQWSLGGIEKRRLTKLHSSNSTLAGIIMQLILPGTPNIFYGDEIALKESHDPRNEHNETIHLHHLSPMQWNNGQQFTNRETLSWLPSGAETAFNNFDDISKMIQLRSRSPSIYKNSIIKENEVLPNTNVLYNHDTIWIERTYPRRNSFVTISNFGNNMIQMDLSSNFYSGEIVVGQNRNEKIYFSEFEIGPMQSIVVKLDK